MMHALNLENENEIPPGENPMAAKPNFNLFLCDNPSPIT
jgi:hypothetical protein